MSEEKKGEVLFVRGRRFQKQGNLSEAITAYRQAIEQGYAPARLYLAFLYYNETGKYKAALKHLKILYPRYPQVAYNIGFVYEKLKRFPEAIHYYKKAVRKGVTAAHIQLGYVYECLQDYISAIIHYQIAVFKGEPRGNLLLARIYEQMEDWDRANTYYVAAMKSDFSQFNAELQKYIVHNGRTEKAVDIFQKQMKKEINKGPLAQGELHERQGSYDAALRWYQRAIDVGDERGIQHFDALLTTLYNDHEGLLLLLDAADKGSTEAHYHLSLWYQKKGDKSQAIEFIEQYNQLTERKHQKGIDLYNKLTQGVKS